MKTFFSLLQELFEIFIGIVFSKEDSELDAAFGRWPGDESDKELQDKLNKL